MKIATIFIALTLSALAVAQEENCKWRGSIAVGGESEDVLFFVNRTKNEITMFTDADGIPLTNVKFTDRRIEFTLGDERICILDEKAGSYSGNCEQQHGEEMDVEIEIKVEMIPPDDPICSE